MITLYPFSYLPTFLALVITTPTSTDVSVIFVMVHTKYVLLYPPLDFKNYVSHHFIDFNYLVISFALASSWQMMFSIVLPG